MTLSDCGVIWRRCGNGVNPLRDPESVGAICEEYRATTTRDHYALPRRGPSPPCSALPQFATSKRSAPPVWTVLEVIRMFIVQSAVVKGRGGIATAVSHYERMFRELGLRSAVLFSGPSLEALQAQGGDVIAAPKLLTSPISGPLPLFGQLREQLLQRAAGEPIVAIVHSDLTLPALKRILPRARFVAPCHSDKFKHKEAADVVITLNTAQHAAARAALAKPRVIQLGNPYVADAPPPITADGPPRLNFVARFTPTKDPLALLRAAAGLPSPPSLRYFGDGELALGGARGCSRIAARCRVRGLA